MITIIRQHYRTPILREADLTIVAFTGKHGFVSGHLLLRLEWITVAHWKLFREDANHEFGLNNLPTVCNSFSLNNQQTSS
jgi:hypothetical protein